MFAREKQSVVHGGNGDDVQPNAACIIIYVRRSRTGNPRVYELLLVRMTSEFETAGLYCCVAAMRLSYLRDSVKDNRSTLTDRP